MSAVGVGEHIQRKNAGAPALRRGRAAKLRAGAFSPTPPRTPHNGTPDWKPRDSFFTPFAMPVGAPPLTSSTSSNNQLAADTPAVCFSTALSLPNSRPYLAVQCCLPGEHEADAGRERGRGVA